MLINEHTAVSTNKVLLVPYEESHVTTYHEWMQDEEIQQATASEPLTLKEEYEMQRSWRTDHDKLTFIICLPDTQELDGRANGSTEIKKGTADSPARMIGDVNLFLSEPDEDEDEDENGNQSEGIEEYECIGEIEIMIAASKARGNGLGRATVLAFMEYLRRNLERVLEEYREGLRKDGKRVGKGGMNLSYLRVKIGGKNEGSIRLFESVEFVKVGGENYFGEVELRFKGLKQGGIVDDLMKRFEVGGWREAKYGV